MLLYKAAETVYNQYRQKDRKTERQKDRKVDFL